MKSRKHPMASSIHDGIFHVNKVVLKKVVDHIESKEKNKFWLINQEDIINTKDKVYVLYVFKMVGNEWKMKVNKYVLNNKNRNWEIVTDYMEANKNKWEINDPPDIASNCEKNDLDNLVKKIEETQTGIKIVLSEMPDLTKEESIFIDTSIITSSIDPETLKKNKLEKFDYFVTVFQKALPSKWQQNSIDVVIDPSVKQKSKSKEKIEAMVELKKEITTAKGKLLNNTYKTADEAINSLTELMDNLVKASTNKSFFGGIFKPSKVVNAIEKAYEKYNKQYSDKLTLPSKLTKKH